MSDANQAVAAIKAMADVEQAMDAWMRGEATQIEVLMKISSIIGAYEMEQQ